jgi:hypothetical protein
MSQAQVEVVIHAQKTGDKRAFGEIAMSLGYITDAQVRAFLAAAK